MPFRKIFLLFIAVVFFLHNTGAQPKFKYVTTPGYVAQFFVRPQLMVDVQRNQYIWGIFNHTLDIDPGPGTYMLYPRDTITGRNFYVLKLDSNGAFAWAKQTDFGIGSIAVDKKQNLVLTGSFITDSIDVDPDSSELFIKAHNANGGSFVSKWDGGGHLLWTYFPAIPGVSTVATDQADQIIVTGRFKDTIDFDPGPSAALLGASRESMFIVKLDGDGGFRWVRHSEGLRSMRTEIDGSGNILHLGICPDSADVDPGPDTVMRLDPTRERMVVLSKLDSTGVYKWSVLLNTNWYYAVWALTPDNQGNIILAGSCYDTLTCNDISGQKHVVSSPKLYPNRTFLMKITSNGMFDWASDLGDNGSVYGAATGSFQYYPVAIVTDTANNIYLSSSFRDSADFDPGPAIYKLRNIGGQSWVVTASLGCFHPDGSLAWARSFNSKDFVTFGTGIGRDGAGNLYVAGAFADTTDFDPDTSVFEVAPLSQYAVTPFLLKLGLCETPKSYSNIQTCDSFLYNGYVRKESGTYYQRFSNGSCDSIAVLDLTIDTADASVMQVGQTLYAQSPTGIYQWLNCDSGMSAIQGANDWKFRPTVSGRYALMVTDNRCVAVSPCYSLIGTGISSDQSAGGIIYYPNPTEGKVLIDFGSFRDKVSVGVYDLTGRLMKTAAVKNERMLTIEIEGPEGLYFLSVTDEAGNKEILKLIKTTK